MSYFCLAFISFYSLSKISDSHYQTCLFVFIKILKIGNYGFTLLFFFFFMFYVMIRYRPLLTVLSQNDRLFFGLWGLYINFRFRCPGRDLDRVAVCLHYLYLGPWANIGIKYWSSIIMYTFFPILIINISPPWLLMFQIQNQNFCNIGLLFI